jgi:hypothetical protein
VDTDFDAGDLSGAAAGWEQRLLDAMAAYDDNDPYYDEVFDETSARIREAGEASKADIAVITFWKRSAQGSWIGDLLALPDVEVRQTTRTAFAAAGDAAKLDELSTLPGFRRKHAIPTALLCAHDPVDYSVMDRRALSALAGLGLGVGPQRGMTLRYLSRVRAVRERLAEQRHGVTAREVDKGLFILGGPAAKDETG